RADARDHRVDAREHALAVVELRAPRLHEQAEAQRVEDAHAVARAAAGLAQTGRAVRPEVPGQDRDLELHSVRGARTRAVLGRGARVTRYRRLGSTRKR